MASVNRRVLSSINIENLQAGVITRHGSKRDRPSKTGIYRSRSFSQAELKVAAAAMILQLSDKDTPMLEFDSATLANMTAALDHGCKMLSGDCDTAANRKRIGDAIIAAARSYNRSLLQLTKVAESEVSAILGHREKSFFNRLKPHWW